MCLQKMETMAEQGRATRSEAVNSPQQGPLNNNLHKLYAKEIN